MHSASFLANNNYASPCKTTFMWDWNRYKWNHMNHTEKWHTLSCGNKQRISGQGKETIGYSTDSYSVIP